MRGKSAKVEKFGKVQSAVGVFHVHYRYDYAFRYSRRRVVNPRFFGVFRRNELAGFRVELAALYRDCGGRFLHSVRKVVRENLRKRILVPCNKVVGYVYLVDKHGHVFRADFYARALFRGLSEVIGHGIDRFVSALFQRTERAVRYLNFFAAANHSYGKAFMPATAAVDRRNYRYRLARVVRSVVLHVRYNGRGVSGNRRYAEKFFADVAERVFSRITDRVNAGNIRNERAVADTYRVLRRSAVTVENLGLYRRIAVVSVASDRRIQRITHAGNRRRKVAFRVTVRVYFYHGSVVAVKIIVFRTLPRDIGYQHFRAVVRQAVDGYRQKNFARRKPAENVIGVVVAIVEIRYYISADTRSLINRLGFSVVGKR